MYQIYEVFKDKKDGKHMINLSSYSCKKGHQFYSHFISFLHIIGIVQNHNVSREEDIVKTCQVWPDLVHDEPISTELNMLHDKLGREKSQSKRQFQIN